MAAVKAKGIAVVGLTLGFALISGLALKSALNQGEAVNWVLFVVVFFVWLSLFAISSLVFSWKANLSRSGLDVFLILFPLWGELRVLFLLGLAFLASSGLTIAGLKMRHQHGDMVKIHGREVIRAGLPIVILTLSLLFSAAYFLKLNQARAEKDFFLQEENVRSLVRGSSSIFRIFLPTFREDATLDELIAPVADRTSEGEEARRNVFSSLSQRFGQNLTGRETISQVIYQYIANWYNRLPTEAQNLFLVGWVMLSFLALWSVGYIVLLFTPLVFWAVLKVLEAAHLVSIGHVEVEKEVLQL